MARDKKLITNIDNSNLVDYPNGRIKDSTGAGDGTPVNEQIYGDIHEAFAKLMRLSDTPFSGLPDNELNSYQYIDAMRFLASKNDFITPLTSTAGVLVVSTKLGLVTENEHIICKSNIDFTTETNIKGSTGSTYPLTVLGSFKANEYVRLIKTASGVTLIRLSDSNNIDLVVNELLFLKKASQAQENAGAIDTVATTPLSNLVAFIKRVNGTDSPTYLANASINGLYPKEHFSIVANLGASPVKNKGWFSGFDVGASAGINYPISGDFTSAVSLSGLASSNSLIEITMANPMPDLNYKVNISVESEGNIEIDNDCLQFVFKKMSLTKFRIAAAEVSGGVQSLKVHLEVVKL